MSPLEVWTPKSRTRELNKKQHAKRNRRNRKVPSLLPSTWLPFVVGIGASAGGLEALEKLFDHIPSDSGMAYVVIQHLSPDFRSMMDELLSRHTKLRIHRVEDGMEVEPDNVYLIPPKKEMVISEGRLLLTDKDPGQGLSLPIDTFFRSLAQDAGRRCVAVVLSGTGSDGSRGIQEVSHAGGMVIAQDESTSKFDGMPKAAVETGVVDLILPPEQMGSAIVDFGSTGTVRSPQIASPSGDDFQDIVELIRKEHGIDFSWYKSSTVGRRIERRVQILQLKNLTQYVELLRSDAGELNHLYYDLLIGVTQFFRDPAAFERLSTDIIPQMLAGVKDHEEARIWVAGCATGEEAYTLAMIIHEHLDQLDRPISAKIFATDVHRVSLDRASSGNYDAASLSHLSSERVERYFNQVGNGYQVSQELRKMIVFAPHNVIKDAPFTRIDLVSCRNLLIYFQPVAQKKVMSLFHFALKPAGVLFLGPSEGPADLAEEFDPIDRHWRIFRKRRDVRLQSDLNLRTPLELPSRAMPVRGERSGRGQQSSESLIRIFEALAADYLPPGFLIDERSRLLYTLPGGGDFLRHREGVPSDCLLDMVDRELRVALTGAIQRSVREQVSVQFSTVQLRRGDELIHVDVHVKPLDMGPAAMSYMVLLIPCDQHQGQTAQIDMDQLDIHDTIQQRMGLLELELSHTKENLQATIEELETSNEELQATNEELVASNEELQSTNEELHSVNEELYTVNVEHQRKIEELTEINDDMDNLFRATEIGTVFLDHALCIRKFTPNAARVFRISSQDIGRRIDAFRHSLDYDELFQDIRKVSSGERPFIEREVSDQSKSWFFARIFPYKSRKHTGGVLVSLIDISSMKLAQEQANIAYDALNSSINGMILTDLDWTLEYANPSFVRMFEFDPQQSLLDKRLSELFTGKDVQRLSEICTDAESDDRKAHEYSIERHDGSIFHVEVAASIVHSARSVEPRRMISFVDITRRKRAEASRESYAAELELAIETLRAAEADALDAVSKRDRFLAILSHELRNPLAAITNAVGVLEHGSVSEDRIENARKSIRRQSEHMARLMNDLLDVARLTHDKLKLEMEVFDARQTLEEAIEATRPGIEAKQHVLQVQNCTSPLMIRADRSRLLQVVENLLVNASRYTPAGGQIEFKLEQFENQCRIIVSDNGKGIKPEFQNSIFDMFVQDDTSLDRSESGMGVGLTLVRSLTKAMNGTVDAFSEGVGRGSRFTVSIPLTPDHSRSLAGAKGVPARIANREPSDIRVLIVEDNQDSREMLQTLLELEGFQVNVAVDGLEGLETIVRDQPDVALVDIGLPAMDGFQVAHAARERLGSDKRTKLVALTGYGQEADKLRARESGFDLHLVKPIDIASLQQLLRSS